MAKRTGRKGAPDASGNDAYACINMQDRVKSPPRQLSAGNGEGGNVERGLEGTGAQMPPAVAELVGVERDECAATYATVSELAASGGSVTSGDVVGAMEWKGYDPDHVKTSLYGLIDLGVIELASDGSISLTRN